MCSKKVIFLAGLLYAACATSAHAQWVTVPSGSSGSFESAYFFDGQNGVVSSSSKVLKTSDAGSSWTPVSVNGIRDIEFANNTLGYAAGYAGSSLKKTTDGGNTWTPLTPPTSNALWGVSVVNANTLYVSGTGKVVWKSTNGGSSFSVVDLPPGPSDLVVDLDFVSTTTGCALGQYRGVWRTTTGGLSWTNTYPSANIEYVSIHFVDGLTGFVVGEAGTILKTIDGGITWNPQVSGSASRLQYVHFLDLNNGIVAGYDGTILHTVDGGATWIKENSGVTEKLRVCYLISPTVAIAGGDNGLMLKNSNLSTGVEEAEICQTCKIFPNPSRGTFSVESEEPIQQVKVFDSLGRLVWESALVQAPFRVDLGGRTSGVYYLQAAMDGKTYFAKIVKE